MESRLTWEERQRRGYLLAAKKALTEGLPRTAKQCLENARTFARLGENTDRHLNETVK